jgi:hypothetical protein
VASASRFTAPVHIDVGGTIYTSSLDTLTRYLPTKIHLPGTYLPRYTYQVLTYLDKLTRYLLTLIHLPGTGTYFLDTLTRYLLTGIRYTY